MLHSYAVTETQPGPVTETQPGPVTETQPGRSGFDSSVSYLFSSISPHNIQPVFEMLQALSMFCMGLKQVFKVQYTGQASWS